MKETILITTPVAEPVTAADMMVQLGMVAPSDPTLLAQLTTQLTDAADAAREYCENYTRTTFYTQTWQHNRDGWPPVDGRYHIGGSFKAEFRIPKPPFQSIGFMQYVDVNGDVQTLLPQTDYGSNPNDPIYGYQLDPGANTKPARLMPPWAKPWPPIRRVANAVMLQFKCGYGGPVMASMGAASALLTGPTFNPGDAGQAIRVPGAGAAGAVLVTSILSVGGEGNATLAASSVAAVNNVQAYAGAPLPKSIYRAIKLLAQFYYQNGSDTDLPMPRVIPDLLEMYRNRIS